MFPAEKIPGTYRTGDWVGSTARLDVSKKRNILFLLGTQSQIIKPPYRVDCTSCMAIGNTSNINTKKHIISKILHFEVEKLMASVVLLKL